MSSPEGIAIDHLGRTMFWTDSMKDHIEVASLDGSQRRVIVDTDLVNPRAIVTDPANGSVKVFLLLNINYQSKKNLCRGTVAPAMLEVLGLIPRCLKLWLFVQQYSLLVGLEP